MPIRMSDLRDGVFGAVARAGYGPSGGEFEQRDPDSS